MNAVAGSSVVITLLSRGDAAACGAAAAAAAPMAIIFGQGWVATDLRNLDLLSQSRFHLLTATRRKFI